MPPLRLVPSLVLEHGLLFAESFLPSKDSNNPLAVELESENDPACQIFQSDVLKISVRLKQRLHRDKDFFK